MVTVVSTSPCEGATEGVKDMVGVFDAVAVAVANADIVAGAEGDGPFDAVGGSEMSEE